MTHEVSDTLLRAVTDRMELRVDQALAAQVQCCKAGQVAYPTACPWHGEDDPMHDPQYKRGGKA